MKLLRPITMGLILFTAFPFLRGAAQARPNIVFFLADDLRPDCLGILGHPIVKTPNIDKLCENGFIFREAHILGANLGAVCICSRTMIQTGQSYLVRKPVTPTLAKMITGAGYATIRSGKFVANPNQLDVDFNEHVDGDHAEGNADNLIKFIAANAGRKPLFLYMAGHEPHDPQYAPDEYYQMYRASDIPLPVNFLPYHPFDNGEMEVRDEKTLPWPRTRETVTGKLARYYASITYWDAQVGRVIQALKQAGEFENTVFVVAGDNGLSLGEHGLLGKQNLYEFGGMHVPLIFAGKGVKKGETNALAYLYDVYPTFCELSGIPVPSGLAAKSLLPLVTGKPGVPHDVLLTGYKDVQRSIRDNRWHLIRYPEVDVTQLFDLEKDPHEMTNLAANPEQAGKIRELLALMAETQVQYSDTAPLTVAHPNPAAWDPSKAAPRKAKQGKGP